MRWGDGERVEEVSLHLFGTYEGKLLNDLQDDDLPAGSCGKSRNELKSHMYEICMRVESQFSKHTLTSEQRSIEARFITP